MNTIRRPPTANANTADRPARVPPSDARRPVRYSPNGRGIYPLLTSERPLTNDDRYDLFRDRLTLHRQGSGDCAPSEGGAAFSVDDPHVVDDEESWWQACLGMIGLILFLAALIIVAAWLGDQIQAAPQPEERCFENHLSGETYCRSQYAWEAD